MDFEKNPLVNDISRCRCEAKRWLALVVFTLAALAIAICINAMWPSPVSREIAIVMAIASVMAITCSFFGIKQSGDHCRSVQYGLSVFEAMNKDLEDTQNEKATLRKALQWFRSSCRDLLFDIEIAECEKAKLQKDLDTAKRELEDTRNELASAGYAIESIRNGFCQAKKNAKALQDKLDIVKHERDDLQSKLNSAYDMLRDEIVAADNALYDAEVLQNELNVARRVAGERLIELSKLKTVNSELQYELKEAKMGFEWYLYLYSEAEERIAHAKEQIKRLEQQIERLETVNKLLAKFATDDV